MPTIIENINSLINTKNELNAILNENGVDGGEIFSEYPSYFRSVIAQGGGGSDKVSYSYLEEKLSYYVLDSYLNTVLTDYPSISYVDENYVSYSYFYSYLNEWGESEGHNLVDRVVGLEEKTTQLDYRQAYSESYLITYNQRISSLENAGYVSQNSLSSNSYASTSYVVDKFNEITGYITGTDKDIIPSESNTYTLGNASYLYSTTYTKSIYSESLILSDSYNSIDNVNNTQINFKINGWNRAKLTNTGFMPSTNNGITLGHASNQWSTTYTRDLYLNGHNAYTMFVTQDDLSSRGFLTQHQDLSAYATIAYVNEKIPISYDMSLYVTYTYMYSYVGNVVGDIETLLSNI